MLEKRGAKVKTIILCLFALLALTAPAQAQDWQRGWKGNVMYNCDAVHGIVADFGDELLAVGGIDDLTPGDGDAEHYVLRGGASTVAESTLGRAPGCGAAPEETDGIINVYEPDRWRKNITGDYFYQCDVLRAIVSAYGDFEYRRDGDRHHTVIGFYQEDAPDCIPRYVVTRVHSDIHACAGSDCEKTGRVMRWLAWPVVGLSEGWYEIALDDGAGFINADDVASGPLDMLQVEERHLLQYAECIMVPQRKPDDFRHIAVIKGGPAYQEVGVAIYKPATDTALEIIEELEGEFSNNGQPYILQLHTPVEHYPNGVYTVELSWEGLTFRFGIHAEERALYYIHVYCNRRAEE